MNSPALKDKLAALKTNKKLQYGVGGGLLVAFALFGGMKIGASSLKQPEHGKTEAHAKASREVAAHGESHEAVAHAESSEKKGIWETYKQAWESVQARADVLKRADEENQRLRLENANLRLRVETLHFDCRAEEASNASHDLGMKLEKETGSRLARTLATVQYKAPSNLTPQQLYTLAVSYFKAHEDEKAAVILSILTGLQDDNTYKSARTYIMTGIAWYRLDNLSEADLYFEKAQKAEDGPGESRSEHTQSQALLWRGVVAERMGKHVKSQEWLREVLNHDPHSTEAAWVNPREADRATASTH